MKHAGKVDERAGHPGAGDAVDDREVLLRQHPPAVHQCLPLSVVPRARRYHLDRAPALEPRNAQEPGGRPV